MHRLQDTTTPALRTTPVTVVARPSHQGSATPAQVLAIVCVGMVLANLDLFIVNVALPNIEADFKGASLEELSWVLNGYAIAYAALLVFFGRVAERHRRDRSFLMGVALFTIASAGCSVAYSVVTLVAARLLQAVGAALLTPTSISLILASYPPDRRGGAVRIWAAIRGAGSGTGAADWRLACHGKLALDLPGQRPDRARRDGHRLVEAPRGAWA